MLQYFIFAKGSCGSNPPEIRLLPTSKYVSAVQLAIDAGRDPCKARLLGMKKVVMSVHAPMSFGRVPEMFEASMCLQRGSRCSVRVEVAGG